MTERLEVLLQVERRSGRDRHEDFVAGKVEAGGIARVDASIPFIQDRELVRRMTGGVVEHQGMRPQVESILKLYRAEAVRRTRAHRAEQVRLVVIQGLVRTSDALRRVHGVLYAPPGRTTSSSP